MSTSHMKKEHQFFPPDPHPKLEITDTFDLFLNTDLCKCVSFYWQWDEKKEAISGTRNLITLPVQWLLCCVSQCASTKTYTIFTDVMHVLTHSCRECTHGLIQIKPNSFLFATDRHPLKRCSLERQHVMLVWVITASWLEWYHRVFCLYLPILICLLK